jgi:PadR family transcriptional regulator AphA
VCHELQPRSELGRVWSLSRPLTYRAIDTLEQDGWIRRSAPRDGDGADKYILSATSRGRAALLAWLDTPTTHLRDVRTELLVKLLLRARLGLSNHKFLAAQRKALQPLIDAVRSTETTDIVSLWRRESAEATRRFLDSVT